MDLNDFIPFKNEFNKAYYGITSNATHTSEKPLFDELRVRRYQRPMTDISDFILEKIDHWLGWMIKSEKTAVGGMNIIRAEVSSVLLFGLKIDVTFGLYEEKDGSGAPITTVNAKAETQIESKGDLGESRRSIRMMLGSMDFNFKKDRIKEEEYQCRSLDTKGSAAAMQQMFNDAQLQHTAKADGGVKATTIELKKRPPVQTIQLKPSVKREEPAFSPAAASATNGATEFYENAPSTRIPVEEIKISKPKITIVTKKTY